MPAEIAILGDVHGAASALESAAAWLLEHWSGHVVFVGDYVNRGPSSEAVLDILVELQEQFGERLTLLQGNHDAVLLEFLDGGSRERFLAHGGLQTIRSYLGSQVESDPFAQFRRQFPPQHLQLLRRLELCFETAEILVTHAGFNPENPESRAAEDVVFGRFHDLFAVGLETPSPLVVCGHYVQRTKEPYLTENFVCLDTGCGSLTDAPLSMLLLPTRQIRTFSGDK